VETELVLVGDAQQLADRRDRERVGQVVDDIDPGFACEAVDQAWLADMEEVPAA
jgi:hypothetical protein